MINLSEFLEDYPRDVQGNVLSARAAAQSVFYDEANDIRFAKLVKSETELAAFQTMNAIFTNAIIEKDPKSIVLSIIRNAFNYYKTYADIGYNFAELTNPGQIINDILDTGRKLGVNVNMPIISDSTGFYPELKSGISGLEDYYVSYTSSLPGNTINLQNGSDFGIFIFDKPGGKVFFSKGLDKALGIFKKDGEMDFGRGINETTLIVAQGAVADLSVHPTGTLKVSIISNQGTIILPANAEVEFIGNAGNIIRK